MKWVLDTNVVSALMRGDPGVLARLKQVNRQDVCLPQPVLAELAYGLARLPASKRRSRLGSRFALIRDELARCPWTDEVSERLGAIKADLERRGERIEDFDVAVAAHAVAQAAVLVTANLSHLTRIPGLRVQDWVKTA